MEALLTIFAPVIVFVAGVGASSVRIINEGNEALVERLGQFNQKLEPGLNFIIPLLDKIVVEETVREKVLDIEPQSAITADNVSLKADAVIYWQILDLESAFYKVEDLAQAIRNLVLTALRSEIGMMELEETYSSRNKINKALLQQLDEATESWGVKITRVEVREIAPAQTVMDSLEQERAAESRKRAALLETEGTVGSIEMISQALRKERNHKEVLQYLVAQRYLDANQKLGESPNSKILFMDPKNLNEALADLMSTGENETTPFN